MSALLNALRRYLPDRLPQDDAEARRMVAAAVDKLFGSGVITGTFPNVNSRADTGASQVNVR